MTLPATAALPAVDARRYALAEMSGRRAVAMALAGGPKPSQVLTPAAFDNAIRVDIAIPGRTHALIHLVAIAARARCLLPASRRDQLLPTHPVLLFVILL